MYCVLNATEDNATTVMYVWQVAMSLMKEELKSALTEVGAPCVSGRSNVLHRILQLLIFFSV